MDKEVWKLRIQICGAMTLSTTTLSKMTLSIKIKSIIGTSTLLILDSVPLGWVLLCWPSNFYYYDEFHSSECGYAEFFYCRNADSCYAQCQSAKCCSDECHIFITILSFILMSVFCLFALYWMSLYWVSLRWVSLTYYCAEFHSAEYYYVECFFRIDIMTSVVILILFFLISLCWVSLFWVSSCWLSQRSEM